MLDVSGKLTGFKEVCGCVVTVESDFTPLISVCDFSFGGELFDGTSTVLVGTGETILFVENENPVDELVELIPKPPKIGGLFSCLSVLVANVKVDSVGLSVKLKLLATSVGLVLASTDDDSEVNLGSESVFAVEVLKLVWAPNIFDEGKVEVVVLGWELNMLGEVKLGVVWVLNIFDILKLAVVVCWPNIVVVCGEPNIFEDFVVFVGIGGSEVNDVVLVTDLAGAKLFSVENVLFGIVDGAGKKNICVRLDYYGAVKVWCIPAT